MTPLYVLHGALGSAEQMAGVAKALGGTAFEFAGHGNTPLGDTPFTVERFRDQLACEIDARAVSEVVLFGYSMGGYVALLLAMTDSRVQRVATLGTKFEWSTGYAGRACSRLDPAAITTKVPAFAAELFNRHERSGGWEINLSNTAALLRALAIAPSLELSAIPQPVHVLVGDRDATVSIAESERVAQALPSGTVSILPDTPHPIEKVDVRLLASILNGQDR